MKARNKFCCALASLVLLMGSLAAPAFAYGAETEPAPDPAPTPVMVPAAEPAEEAPVTVQEEVSGPLTPEGNLSLVDDYHTTYSDGSGQQFITMVSKSGAYFRKGGGNSGGAGKAAGRGRSQKGSRRS